MGLTQKEKTVFQQLIKIMLSEYDTNVVVVKGKEEVHFVYDVPGHLLQLYLTLCNGSSDILEQVMEYGVFCINKNRKRVTKKTGAQLSIISTIKND